MSMKAPEYAGEYIMQLLHEGSEQRKGNSPHHTPFPLGFPILTSFYISLYQVIESEAFAGGCRGTSAEVAIRRKNALSPQVPLIWIC